MIPDPNYIYISSNNEMDQVEDWLDRRNYVVFDIETGPGKEYLEEWNRNSKIGLDPYRNAIFTIQIGDYKNQFIIDTRTVSNVDPVLRVLEDIKVSILGVNLRFDFKNMMHHYKIIPNSAIDAMIMEQVIRNGIFPVKEDSGGTGGATRRYTGMKALAQRYFNLDIDKDKEFRVALWKHEPNEFSDRALKYMANDCVLPDLIIRRQKSYINERGLQRIAKLENALIPVIADMELTGIPFDINSWTELLQESTIERIELEKKLDNYFGVKAVQQFDLLQDSKTIRPINYDSPKQLAKALNSIGVRGFMSPNGKPLSTNTPKIVRMKVRGEIDTELADTIIKYKKTLQRESSYGAKFLSSVHPITKRIHPDYTQTCLVTGRMSASPGVQTIPRDPRYRASFKAPDGYTFIILDASQIEARLSCDLTGDAEGIEVFSNYGDIYKEDGQKFYNRVIDKNTEEGAKLRQKAKNAWLGLSYGQGKTKFHDWSTYFLEENIQKDDTDYLFDKFFEIHHEMKRVMDGWSDLVNPETSNRYIVDDIVDQFINPQIMYAKLYDLYFRLSKGDEVTARRRAQTLVENRTLMRYAETLMGRKRFFRADFMGHWTAGRNHPVQGTAADIQKLTLLNYQKMHWEEGWDAHVVLVVHDELVTLVREDQAEALYERQKKLGEETGQMFLKHVPMIMDGGISKKWCKF